MDYSCILLQTRNKLVMEYWDWNLFVQQNKSPQQKTPPQKHQHLYHNSRVDKLVSQFLNWFGRFWRILNHNIIEEEEYGVKYYMYVMENTIFSWIGNQLENSTVKVKLDNCYAKEFQVLEKCELELELWVELYAHLVVLNQATIAVFCESRIPWVCRQNRWIASLRWLVSDYDCFCSTLNKILQRFLFLFFLERLQVSFSSTHTPSAHPSPKDQNPSVLYIENK